MLITFTYPDWLMQDLAKYVEDYTDNTHFVYNDGHPLPENHIFNKGSTIKRCHWYGSKTTYTLIGRNTYALIWVELIRKF